jgi:hypothetical protein
MIEIYIYNFGGKSQLKRKAKKCCNKINKATTRLKHEINKTKPNYNFKFTKLLQIKKAKQNHGTCHKNSSYSKF